MSKSLVDIYQNKEVFIHRNSGTFIVGFIVSESIDFISVLNEQKEIISIPKNLIKEIVPKRVGGGR